MSYNMDSPLRESKKFDWRWAVLAIALIGVVVLAVAINLNYNHPAKEASSSNIDIDNGDSKINWNHYQTYDVELSDTLTIASSGTYHLTGSIEDGMINIKITDEAVVRLILDNVSIKNSSGPAIACYGGDDLVLELVGENHLEDGKSYSGFDEDVNGAIYSKADLTFTGSGSLSIQANYQDAIVGKDDLKINGGNYSIIANDDGIRGKDSVYITDGKISIEAKGDGIKSTNETDSSKGFVLIAGGEITLAAGDDGIHAYNKLIIDDGKVSVTKSYEGLEAQQITINDGEVSVFANDDGINAGGGNDNSSGNRMGTFDTNENCILSINGGSVYVNAAGDGIDSNGYLYINGGSVVVDGPTNNGNGALDAGAQIVMSGGDAIAVGASGMATNLGTTSTVYNVSVYFATTQAKDTKIEIKDENGDTIISHTSAKTFSHMAVGTTKFEFGKTYSIYLNGLLSNSFTISGTVTTVGGNNSATAPGQGANRAPRQTMQR